MLSMHYLTELTWSTQHSYLVNEWTKDSGKVLSIRGQGEQSPWPPPPPPPGVSILIFPCGHIYLPRCLPGCLKGIRLTNIICKAEVYGFPNVQDIRQMSEQIVLASWCSWEGDVLRQKRRIFSVTKGRDWSPIPGITPSYTQRSKFPFSKFWCCQCLSSALSKLLYPTVKRTVPPPLRDLDLTLSSNSGAGEVDSLVWAGRVTF